LNRVWIFFKKLVRNGGTGRDFPCVCRYCEHVEHSTLLPEVDAPSAVVAGASKGKLSCVTLCNPALGFHVNESRAKQFEHSGGLVVFLIG